MISWVARWLVVVGLAAGAWAGVISARDAQAAGQTPPGQTSAAHNPQVTGIEVREQGGATTISIDLSRRVDYRVFFLNEPMRAIIDLPPVGWALPATVPAPRGLIAGYRYGLFDRDTSRLVLDLAGPARVQLVRYDLLPGRTDQRLVIALEHTTQAAFEDQIQPWTQSVTKQAGVVAPARAAAEAVPARATPAVDVPRAEHPPLERPSVEHPAVSLPTAPAPRPPPALATPALAVPTTPRVAAVTPLAPGVRPSPRRPERVHVVALDAGHGGVDPGTIGMGGIFEKNITLPTVLELRRQLEATGHYKVVLTRNQDIFVPLRERVAIARAANAELFISIHADSIRNRDTRGASVYTLSETASDAEAAALAAKENRADIIAGVNLAHENKEVTSILIDLAQRESMNRSATLASLLVDDLGRQIHLIPVKPHRFAGFAVLKAPDIPSVLIELGYLSNPGDEKLLTEGRERAKVAVAIRHAIDRYFQGEAPPS
ncbi:MAG TPA: N-acetylmuramoyl-L-alanine amidase [Alphaproteobacteria bacterium]|nr:N-acetylmuramoyl-L-alanine amidase [Alphaproteobacteria bacterium]